MAAKPRLDISMDAEVKRQIKAAAAKQGMSMSQHCAQAIEQRSANDEEGRSAKPGND